MEEKKGTFYPVQRGRERGRAFFQIERGREKHFHKEVRRGQGRETTALLDGEGAYPSPLGVLGEGETKNDSNTRRESAALREGRIDLIYRFKTRGGKKKGLPGRKVVRFRQEKKKKNSASPSGKRGRRLHLHLEREGEKRRVLRKKKKVAPAIEEPLFFFVRIAGGREGGHLADRREAYPSIRGNATFRVIRPTQVTRGGAHFPVGPKEVDKKKAHIRKDSQDFDVEWLILLEGKMENSEGKAFSTGWDRERVKNKSQTPIIGSAGPKKRGKRQSSSPHLNPV